MLQVHTSLRLDQVELALRIAAERHGGRVVAVGHVLKDAHTYTMCFQELYDPLLRSDVRFAGFLPSRIAAYAKGTGTILATLPPREYCRIIHRPDVEPLAAGLEEVLRAVMEEAAHRVVSSEHLPTEDQINMRAALPQRIDCHGTKVEELAGTGVHDAQGG